VFLVAHGWAGGISFDEAVAALVPEDDPTLAADLALAEKVRECRLVEAWDNFDSDYDSFASAMDAITAAEALDEYESAVASIAYVRRQRDAARADADRLAEALREAIGGLHSTDSLRSHSDDERTDGWFRAPLYRCADATCEQAREALRQHEERDK
jgi:hypothetical protein